MSTLDEITKEQIQKIKNSFRVSISQADYIMMPHYVALDSNEELQQYVDKIPKELMPTDYEPSKNKVLLRVIFAEESFK